MLTVSEGKCRKKSESIAKLKTSPTLRKNKLAALPYCSKQTKVAKGKQKGQQKAQNNKNRLLRSFVLSTVPIIAAAAACWISIPTRWRRNSIARAFPVTCFTRLLTSVRNALAPAPQVPVVSNPIGCTINRFARASSLRCFRVSAAAPACCDV